MTTPTDKLTGLAAEVAEIIEADPVLRAWVDAREGFWGSFKPRPNKPEVFDEQQAFVESRAAVAFMVGGNASLHE